MADPVYMEDQERGGQVEVDPELVEEISVLMETDQRGMVLNVVADLHPADIARLVHHLPFEQAHRLFHWLPVEEAGEVLAEMEGSRRAALLDELQPDRIKELLDELDTDDAADVLGDLPDHVARRVLPGLEDAADLRELLAYDEETAGGIMGTEFVSVPFTATVDEATEEVRANAEAVEHIYAVYVVDEGGRLQGIVSLKRLLLSPAHARISDIMSTDVHSVTPDVDQEEVALIMERYDLVSLPVVDGQSRLIGRITIDDVVDVIRDEAEEDIQLMVGGPGDEDPGDSVMRISRGRLPWLLVGLFGAALSGTVIRTFEDGLAQAVVLAMFIPIVTAMGGNAAVQSAAIAVRGLTSGELWLGDMMRRMLKEFVVALMNGLVLAALVSSFVMVFQLGDVRRLSLTVGLTMFAVIILATTNGALVPFILKRLGVDPASAMGPFVTTLNDIIGLSVYFLIASLIYL
jgi:magnesium transporter